MKNYQTIQNLLNYIYNDPGTILEELKKNLEKWENCLSEKKSEGLTENDIILITYGDNIYKHGEKPLKTLKRFADQYLTPEIPAIHILPFFPYSSDDGFSVVDYRQVNPDYGTWDDIKALNENFSLMFDLVLNHCSKENSWFREFLNGSDKYRNYFIPVEKNTDLSSVFRPRALPLLHTYQHQKKREILIWTTFSEDQVDLNFSAPEVFLEFIDILLFYISRGADFIRLDAIGFLWKEIGTSCMHHPKTHAMVRLFREILKQTTPHAVLITETNVPHRENVSYFGSGNDEAQMVYQFPLPPLTLDAFIRSDTSYLTRWAQSLEKPSPDHTFFNFLASHDGIGVLPAREYLTPDQMTYLLKTVKDRGGEISYKSTPEGDIPYELNISYKNAITNPHLTEELRIRQFLTSQSIMLTMAGVPGIYIHSLLGSGNWREGMKKTGMKRSINREKLQFPDLILDLDSKGSERHVIFTKFKKMISVRRRTVAFHPAAEQTILDMGNRLFVNLRENGNDKVLCLHNVSGETVPIPEDLLPDGFRVADKPEVLWGDDQVFDGNIGACGTLWLSETRNRI